LEAVFFFEANFRFFPQQTLGNFGLICFSSVILTNFAKFGQNLPKFQHHKYDKKKKKNWLEGVRWVGTLDMEKKALQKNYVGFAMRVKVIKS
jgi:hypothetical protein